jgi:Na+-transporting NADH:ubiquinone oxidoreductase subunit B
MGLRESLDKMKPLFEKGGKLEKLYPLYEAQDTFLFTPDEKTHGTTHVRDHVDLKRVMITVVLALLPCLFFGMYNAGYQHFWINKMLEGKGFMDFMLQGALEVMPIILVSYIVGGLWEVFFCVVRKHEINEGFLVTGLLFPLTCPTTIPLWTVAVGISFGVVIGKEVFGGTGFNFLNPALTARAYVFFAHPKWISGEIWADKQIADGMSGATTLADCAVAPVGGQQDIINWLTSHGHSLWNTFIGLELGSIGETSVIACLIGAVVLIATGVGSWRIMAACVVGLFLGQQFLNLVVPEGTTSYARLPFLYHLCAGGFMFGTVFMATDPVSAASTNPGKWIYGILIGFLTVMVRVVNPGYAEGVMISILFMNVMAPVIDHCVLQFHIRKREAHLRRFQHAKG